MIWAITRCIRNSYIHCALTPARARRPRTSRRRTRRGTTGSGEAAAASVSWGNRHRHQWRAEHPGATVDLRSAYLAGAILECCRASGVFSTKAGSLTLGCLQCLAIAPVAPAD